MAIGFHPPWWEALLKVQRNLERFSLLLLLQIDLPIWNCVWDGSESTSLYILAK